jgi:hypothetical protein
VAAGSVLCDTDAMECIADGRRMGSVACLVAFDATQANHGARLFSLCAIQSGLNAIQEVALIERLGQIADDPGLKCAGSNIIARIRSYHDGGNRFAQSRQIIVQIKAIHSGHVEVDNQAAGAAQFGRPQELLARRKCLRDQPDRAHQNLDCVSNRFVVVDYGNYWTSVWHLVRPATARHLLRNNGCRP